MENVKINRTCDYTNNSNDFHLFWREAYLSPCHMSRDKYKAM